MTEEQLVKLIVGTVEDELRKRDSMLEWYRVLPCKHCGEVQGRLEGWDEL